MKTNGWMKTTLAATAFAVAVGASASFNKYQVVNLGSISGGTFSKGFAVNNQGHVAGWCDITGGHVRGFFYDGTLHTIVPGVGGNNSYATGLNDNDVITGFREKYNASTGVQMLNGFMWNYPGSLTWNVGNFGASDSFSSTPYDINNSNVVVGCASGYGGSSVYNGFSWTTNGGMVWMGTLTGMYIQESRITGISPAGEMSGYGKDANGNTRTIRIASNNVFYNTGGFVLNGTTVDTASYDINDYGKAVGNYKIDATTYRACSRVAGGSWVSLGKLSGSGSAADDSSVAQAINNSGDIVGDSEIGNGNHHAFIIPSGGSMTDLNSFLPAGSGWVLQFAMDISENGYITGYGTYNGATRGFLLKPLVTVSGKVNLQDLSVDESGFTPQFQIIDSTNDSVLETMFVPLGVDGSYSITTGNFGPNRTIRVKAWHWLAQSLPVNLIGDRSNVNFDLVNGDVDLDNEVSLGDYARIAAAIGTVFGDPGYDVGADLDYDQEVTLADYAILAKNFGQAGD